MADDFSPAAFEADDFYPPQATVSLSETTLVTPSTPESIDDEVKEEGDDKKPTKKRKSWGQELPTPKTNLPPRKRAKTEDEKEQRRIERVLRNRQAAQSSRERKRQEVEKLEGEKHAIEQQNQLLKERLMAVEHEKFKLAQQVAKMAAEMSVFKQGGAIATPMASSCAPSPNLEADLLHQQIIKQELDDYPFALPTPQASLGSSAFSPEPSSSLSSRSPSPSNALGIEATTTSPDMAQHPAEMFYESRRSSAVSTSADDAADFDPPVLSDADFSRLFESPTSPPPDLQFFADGLVTTEDGTSEGVDVFSFDQMVDLDACQPHADDDFQLQVHEDGQTFDGITHQPEIYFEHFTTTEADDPHQHAATSSALQPCLGAPS